MFLDPTASHLIVCTSLGENYYLHSQSRQPRPLAKLRGVSIDTVAWSPSLPTASTREILIGASDGNIYEGYLETSTEFYRKEEKVHQGAPEAPRWSDHRPVGGYSTGENGNPQGVGEHAESTAPLGWQGWERTRWQRVHLHQAFESEQPVTHELSKSTSPPPRSWPFPQTPRTLRSRTRISHRIVRLHGFPRRAYTTESCW